MAWQRSVLIQAFVMLRWHLHIKMSRYNHLRTFSRNGEKVATYIVQAVTGSTWQLWDIRGCYGAYVELLQGCHIHLITATWQPSPNPFRENNLSHVTFTGRIYMKVWPRHYSTLPWQKEASDKSPKSEKVVFLDWTFFLDWHFPTSKLSFEQKHSCCWKIFMSNSQDIY